MSVVSQDQLAAVSQRIHADMMKAGNAAARYEKRFELHKSYRALGIAEGLRSALGYIDALTHEIAAEEIP